MRERAGEHGVRPSSKQRPESNAQLGRADRERAAGRAYKRVKIAGSALATFSPARLLCRALPEAVEAAGK